MPMNISVKLENQNIISDLMNKVQELQVEVNCMLSRDFKDAESVRSGLYPTFHVNECYFLLKLIREDC